MDTMKMPGFTAEASYFKTSRHYQSTNFANSATPTAGLVQPSLPQGTMRRIGLGISYPPPGGGCQICDCTCYPFPC